MNNRAIVAHIAVLNSHWYNLTESKREYLYDKFCNRGFEIIGLDDDDFEWVEDRMPRHLRYSHEELLENSVLNIIQAFGVEMYPLFAERMWGIEILKEWREYNKQYVRKRMTEKTHKNKD